MNTSTRRPPHQTLVMRRRIQCRQKLLSRARCSRSHRAGDVHLGHVCTPGAAGIARREAREVVKSAPTIRLGSFYDRRTSQRASPVSYEDTVILRVPSVSWVLPERYLPPPQEIPPCVLLGCRACILMQRSGYQDTTATVCACTHNISENPSVPASDRRVLRSPDPRSPALPD